MAASRWKRVQTLARLLAGHQVAPDVESPHVTLVDDPQRTLRRYGSDGQFAAARASGRPPILLVPPLAVPARCYDLGPGQSAVEHLLAAGRIPYVVDFGDVGQAHRHVGFETYIDDIVPQAIDRVLADYSGTGEAAGVLDVAAWSLGGTVSLLMAAAHPDLPVRSITAIGTPLDYDAVSPYPLVKQVMQPVGGVPITASLKVMGGIPAPLVRIAYRALAADRELKKPLYIMRNADDHEALARMQVIDRFQNAMPGYAGKVSLQMWENFVYRGELASGVVDFDGRIIDLRTLRKPVQLFGSHRDAIASWDAAHHGVELLEGSSDVHFETVETSHLGLIAGDAASEQTWPRVEQFLDELDARDAV
ncbi:alpha/beta hydrolase [Gordonia aichiensis]|uniref:Putative hydrolase n=1 Tax=Gordonia aichiensis NBRC 108223 TaxID=1220583 RepID=L7KML1_9ACTN|nr:alpha/beta hydrolase [Gordonia aichiensis]GAC50095.1 putative hydrolase [Gordonia aichiensis NBRC 108223]